MRAISAILSLVVVLAIVGVLAKRQLSPAPVAGAAGTGEAPQTPSQQGQAIQQQMQQSLEKAMQQARPMPTANNADDTVVISRTGPQPLLHQR